MRRWRWRLRGRCRGSACSLTSRGRKNRPSWGSRPRTPATSDPEPAQGPHLSGGADKEVSGQGTCPASPPSQAQFPGDSLHRRARQAPSIRKMWIPLSTLVAPLTHENLSHNATHNIIKDFTCLPLPNSRSDTIGLGQPLILLSHARRWCILDVRQSRQLETALW